MKTEDIIYVSGAMFYDEKTNNNIFELIKPSSSKYAYFTKNPNNVAMKFSGETAALYRFDKENKKLINMNNPHYNSEQPQTINLTDEMFNYIIEGIACGETCLGTKKEPDTETSHNEIEY